MMDIIKPSISRREQNSNLFYCLDGLTYLQFINYLWNGTFLDDLTLLTTNPTDVIISSRIYPYSPPSKDIDNTVAVSTLQLGNIAYSGFGDTPYVDAQVLGANYSSVLTIGDIAITPTYNNYLDNAPYTDITVYLPYVGFVSVNATDVMGKSIGAKYVVDYSTGNADVYLTVTDYEESRILNTYQATLGFDIPITGSNQNEVLLNTLTSSLGFLGGVLKDSTNIASLVESGAKATKSIMTYPDKSYIGNTSRQWSAMYSPYHMYAIIKRPNAIVGEDYAKLRGIPSGKIATLGALSGYTEVETIHVEGVSTATQDELTEIERLLKGGVIL